MNTTNCGDHLSSTTAGRSNRNQKKKENSCGMEILRLNKKTSIGVDR